MRAVAFVTVCLTVGAALQPASSQQPPRSVPPSTIEPSLPVRADMRLVSVNETGLGGTALLEVSVEAGARIPELSMDLRLPGDLQVQDGTPTNGWMLSLEASEHRRYEIPLFAGHNGVFQIRVEMSFRLPDGRSFRAGQGVTLRLGAPRAVGRMNAGAYEFRGVPLEDLQR